MSLGLPIDQQIGDAQQLAPQDSKKRRRRRRRRDQQLPLQAKLLLDDRSKGYAGLASADLADELFGHVEPGSVHHIAIAPWQPPTQTLVEDGSWTVVPIKVSETELPPSTLRFPTSSFALQSFNSAYQGDLRVKGGVEILVIDVQPVTLETIFVRVDGDSLRKHEDVQRRFGGGFQSQGNGNLAKGKGKASDRPHSSSQNIEDDLIQATRAALDAPTIIHRGDLFPIPLPAHPITHVPFPPVEIVICEPVDQGVVSANTKIVIDVDSKGKHSIRHALRSQRTVSYHEDAITDSSEDTSAEQFYSAAENDAVPGQDEAVEDGQANQSATETETEDETDDDDNAISLSQPSLPPQASGVLSSMTAATPRPFGARTNGIASPGSVFSGHTATTARGVPGAKSFDVKPLIKKIPDGVLHPPPPSDDDDESRVYVDVKMLVRIGCFSGDWVKLTVTPPQDPKESLFPLGAFGDDDEPEQVTRTVKIYGLPDVAAADALQRRKQGAGPGMVRRGSIGSVLALARPSPSAYISPILFWNLGKPSNVSLAPLTSQAGESRVVRSKVPSAAAPPVARELTLLRLMTPIATERATSGGIFASLKHHFAKRRRILQTGDLVAVAVDASSSRIMAEDPSNQNSEPDLEVLLVATSNSQPSSDSTEVAWFKVGQIARQGSEEPQVVDPIIWADVASIESDITRLSLNGSDQTSVPIPHEVPWDYYFGTRPRPRQNATGSSVVVDSISSVSRSYVPPLQRRIRDLLAVASSPKVEKFGLPPIVILLHSTQRGIGKKTIVANAASDLGLHFFPIDAYDIISEGAGGGGDVKTEATLRHRIERALQCGSMYTVPLIQHAEALTAERTAEAIKEMLSELKVVVFTTTELDNVSDSIRALVTHELEVSAPDEAEREGILSSLVQNRGIKLSPDIELKAIAVKTAALVAGDLVDVLERASVARESRLEKIIEGVPSFPDSQLLVRDLLVSGGSFSRCVTKPDLDIAVEAARKNFADAIGAPKIPNVTWDDVGGLSHVKDAVMETIQLPLERPELFAKGMKKRSGILFYGPPGTGKTLLAKAIATEFSLNFFSVKGPELLNMYIGESEANVRRVFQRARDARPCVVFFDELDSVAPKRGNQGDSGGVMDRIVSQLLAELDGMSSGGGGSGSNGEGSASADVFVIGATNRPDLLDQALLRPGRFDKMMYLGIADTHDKQLTILEALTRKFTLDPALDLRAVAARLPFLYTGADMYALCSDAMLKAITRRADAVDARIKAMALESGEKPVSTAYFFDHIATKADIDVVVTEQDFVAAQRELVGSVSAKELEHYGRVRAQFESPDGGQQQRQGKGVFTTGGKDNDGHGSVATTQPHLLTPNRAGQRVRPTVTGGSRSKGKGKAKAKAVKQSDDEDNNNDDDDDDDDEDDEDEDAYVTSNDYDSPYSAANGSAKGKGKGKGKAASGFEDAADNDDEELYG